MNDTYELTVRLEHANIVYAYIADENINLSLDDFLEKNNSRYIFNQCEFSHGFNLIGGKNEKCSIFFNNCIFGEEDFSQLALLKMSNIVFYNCKFGRLSLTDVSCPNVQFKECAFLNIDFYDASIKKLTILKPHGESPEVFISSFEMEHCYLNGDFEKVILEEFQVCRLIGNYKVIRLESEKFQKCYLGSSSSLPNRTGVGQFDFFAKVFQGDVYIHNVDVNLFEWSGVSSSNGSLRINDVEVDYFRLKNSTINYLEWSNLRLKNYSLGGSNLFGLKVFNVTWPNDKLFERLLPELPRWKHVGRNQKSFLRGFIPAYKAEMEAYRLLKVSSQNNQNEMDGLEFYRLEMRRLWVIRRLLNEKNSWMNTALLGIGRIVSDFGQNWLLPLLWLFGIHYLLFMSIYEWDYSLNWNDFKNGLGSFFELLNPVHKTPDYINTGMGLFTEFWMRILSGFFIYHFVKATRKYGKI